MFIFAFLSFYQELKITLSFMLAIKIYRLQNSENLKLFSDGSDEKSCEKVDIPGKTKNAQ